jgi:hypothetical protein
MFSMIKTTFAAAIVVGTSSLALAQGFDPNLANRHPHLAQPQTYGYVAGANTPARMDQAPNAAFQSAPVRLHQGRNAAQTGGEVNWSAVDSNDRASSPYAGGGW